MTRQVARRETTAQLFANVKKWTGIKPVSALEETSVIDAFLLGQRVTLRTSGPQPMPAATVRKVRRLLAAGLTYGEVGRIVGLPAKRVGCIARGEVVQTDEVERKEVVLA
ncbi:MAG: hypothetical protein KJZ78_23285 [Bryobacteraceae bacterium]|nr:hypothetical protein [Bryobacteraceae bacterium]